MRFGFVGEGIDLVKTCCVSDGAGFEEPEPILAEEDAIEFLTSFLTSSLRGLMEDHG